MVGQEVLRRVALLYNGPDKAASLPATVQITG